MLYNQTCGMDFNVIVLAPGPSLGEHAHSTYVRRDDLIKSYDGYYQADHSPLHLRGYRYLKNNPVQVYRGDLYGEHKVDLFLGMAKCPLVAVSLSFNKMPTRKLLPMPILRVFHAQIPKPTPEFLADLAEYALDLMDIMFNTLYSIKHEIKPLLRPGLTKLWLNSATTFNDSDMKLFTSTALQELTFTMTTNATGLGLKYLPQTLRVLDVSISYAMSASTESVGNLKGMRYLNKTRITDLTLNRRHGLQAIGYGMTPYIPWSKLKKFHTNVWIMPPEDVDRKSFTDICLGLLRVKHPNVKITRGM